MLLNQHTVKNNNYLVNNFEAILEPFPSRTAAYILK
jgi:hypothetical protein